jgi:hypothetical protein
MDVQGEIERLRTPPPPVPSFWRYLRETNIWAYYNVPMSLIGWVVVVIYFQSWWASVLVGVLAGAAIGNAGGSWGLWRERRQMDAERAAWVERMSTGDRAFPRDLAWTMANLIREGKTHVAAKIALDYFAATDPKLRRLIEEDKS